MSEGTWCSVIRFPLPWPQPVPVRFVDQKVGKAGRLTISGFPDGTLQTDVHENGTLLASSHSQPVTVEGAGWGILFAKWKSSRIELIGNERPLVEYQGPDQDCFVFKSEEHHIPEGEQIPALEHPKAFDLCQGWISWRRSYFENKREAPSAGFRIEKTLCAQIEDLKGQCERIARFMRGISQGESLWFPSLKAELRSMVGWKGDRAGSYNPIMLRLANEAGLPLPVYCFPLYEPDLPPVLDGLEFFYTGHERAELLNRVEGLELVDLQEWLTRSLIVMMREKGPEKKSLAEYLLESSNTSSVAHFDEAIPDYIHGMQDTRLFGVPYEEKVLMNLSEICLVLGWYVQGALKGPEG